MIGFKGGGAIRERNGSVVARASRTKMRSEQLKPSRAAQRLPCRRDLCYFGVGSGTSAKSHDTECPESLTEKRMSLFFWFLLELLTVWWSKLATGFP